jgi:hypothetical protein
MKVKSDSSMQASTPRRGRRRSSTTPVPQLQIAPARFVVIPLGAAVTGLTEKAIRRKIDEGVWREGFEYRRGPDGRIFVDLDGYARWVSGK